MISAIILVLNAFIRPIRKYWLSCIFVVLMLFLPELKDVSLSQRIPYVVGNIFRHIALCGAVSYVLVTCVWVLSKMNGVLSRIVLWLLLFASFLVYVGDIFLYEVFNTHINTYILQLLKETNREEASEFITVYLARWSSVKVLLQGIALFFGFWLIRVLRTRWSVITKMGRVLLTLKYVAALYFVYCIAYAFHLAPLFGSDWTVNDDKANNEEKWELECMNSSFVFLLYQSSLQLINEGESFEECARSQDNIKAIIGNDNVPNIIVVIGESYNRHHSNLYGYSMKTCPALAQVDNLYIFKDVISPVNATTQAFHYFFSLQNVGGEKKWSETPLFPAIFKQVGYNVVFFSNEFVKEVGMDAYDASCGFFNHPLIEPKIFCHRNDRKYKYDGDMIDAFKEKRLELECDSMNLVFFHLIGQHSDYAKRFPSDRVHFGPKDYNRPELNDYQLRELANYDNATCYNDSVVREIIRMYEDKDAVVLYFADHGEEAHDFRDYTGRSRDFDSEGAPCLHCQLDIPFMIFVSNTCRSLHPELVLSVSNAVERPFMIDDLPHLLFDIASVQCDGFDPSRSPINSYYEVPVARMVSDYGMGEFHNYDSICKAFGPWSIGF